MFVPGILMNTSRRKTRAHIVKEKNSRKPSFQVSDGKTKVLFEDHVDIHFIPSRREYSFNEQRGMWYSSEEYEKIIHACIEQIIILESGEHFGREKIS